MASRIIAAVGGGGGSGGGGSGGVIVKAETLRKRTYGTSLEVGTTANPWADNTEYTQAHGLARTPDGWEAYVEFTTAVSGYAVGDRLDWSQIWTATPWVDSTNIGVRTRQEDNIIAVADRVTDSTQSSIDRSNFKVVVDCWIEDDQSVVTSIRGVSASSSQTKLKEIASYTFPFRMDVTNDLYGTSLEVPTDDQLYLLEIRDSENFGQRTNEFIQISKSQFDRIGGAEDAVVQASASTAGINIDSGGTDYNAFRIGAGARGFFLGKSNDATPVILFGSVNSSQGPFILTLYEITLANVAVADATAILRSDHAAPDAADLEDGDHYVVNGTEYKNDVHHLAGTARAVTKFALNPRHVIIPVGTGTQRIVNGNYSSLFAQFHPNDASVPLTFQAAGHFYFNTVSHRYRKTDGTNWTDYDPHADGEPWNQVRPYGAYVDLIYTAGDNDGKGLRITLTGTRADTLGTLGNNWVLKLATSSLITSSVFVQVDTANRELEITVRARDGGSEAPTIVEIAQALNNLSSGSFDVGFDYLLGVTVTDKVDANFQADDDLSFANGSTGTVEVGINLPFQDIEDTESQLDAGWTAAGQVGVDIGSKTIWGTTGFTAGSAAHIEKVPVLYRPPGINDVLDESGAAERALTAGDRGRLIVDSFRAQVAFAARNQIKAVPATGTDELFTQTDFVGVHAGHPGVTSAGKFYYRYTDDTWYYSYLIQGLGVYGWQASPLYDILELKLTQTNSVWIGAQADLGTAVNNLHEPWATTRNFYYYNRASDTVRRIVTRVEGTLVHNEWERRQIVHAGNIGLYRNNPVGEWWLQGQTEQLPLGFPATTFTGTRVNGRVRLQFSQHTSSTGEDYLPNKTYFEGPDHFKGIMLPSGSVSANADNLGSGTKSDREWNMLPAGIWGVQVHVAVESNVRPDTGALIMGLIQVSENTDDILLYKPAYFQPVSTLTLVAGSSPDAVATLDVPLVESDGTSQLYVLLAGLGADAKMKGFFRLEDKR